MAAEKKDYEVVTAGFFYGKYRDVGAVLKLTDSQAKYELMLESIKLYVPAAEAPPVEAVEIVSPKPQRTKRRVSEGT